ncbi:hypothetical protein FQN50_007562 [Emmonsiellopsis sp. PD_5]|nr:hypothetical protein FQN50_007562 [Emmonsiellopsis sp. PD_5]
MASHALRVNNASDGRADDNNIPRHQNEKSSDAAPETRSMLDQLLESLDRPLSPRRVYPPTTVYQPFVPINVNTHSEMPSTAITNSTWTPTLTLNFLPSCGSGSLGSTKLSDDLHPPQLPHTTQSPKLPQPASGPYGSNAQQACPFSGNTSSFADHGGAFPVANSMPPCTIQQTATSSNPVPAAVPTGPRAMKRPPDDVMSAAPAEAVAQSSNEKYGTLDADSLGHNVAIFYFGVLGLMAGLSPTFSYDRSPEGNWTAFLTYLDATIFKDGDHEDKFIAKAETCRKALDMLRGGFSGWALPDLPGPDVQMAHCDHNKLGHPAYTKYVHEDGGVRCEVEVCGTSYFGAAKFYRSETDAANASAHSALYTLLISGEDVMSLFQGVGFAGGFAIAKTAGKPTKKTKDNSKKLPQTATSSTCGKRAAATRKNLAGDPFAQQPRAVSGKAKANKAAPFQQKKPTRRGKAKNNSKQNANLVPIPARGRWVPIPEAPSSGPAASKITARALISKTMQCASQGERVEKICSLLSMEPPEYRVEPTRSDPYLPVYSIVALFPNDPFLARVGPIGYTTYEHGLRSVAQEACAEEVASYLVKMVADDEEWEEENVKKARNIQVWEGRAAEVAVSYSASTISNVKIDTGSSRPPAAPSASGYAAQRSPHELSRLPSSAPFEAERLIPIKTEESAGDYDDNIE